MWGDPLTTDLLDDDMSGFGLRVVDLGPYPVLVNVNLAIRA